MITAATSASTAQLALSLNDGELTRVLRTMTLCWIGLCCPPSSPLPPSAVAPAQLDSGSAPAVTDAADGHDRMTAVALEGAFKKLLDCYAIVFKIWLEQRASPLPAQKPPALLSTLEASPLCAAAEGSSCVDSLESHLLQLMQSVEAFTHAHRRAKVAEAEAGRQSRATGCEGEGCSATASAPVGAPQDDSGWTVSADSLLPPLSLLASREASILAEHRGVRSGSEATRRCCAPHHNSPPHAPSSIIAALAPCGIASCRSRSHAETRTARARTSADITSRHAALSILADYQAFPDTSLNPPDEPTRLRCFLQLRPPTSPTLRRLRRTDARRTWPC